MSSNTIIYAVQNPWTVPTGGIVNSGTSSLHVIMRYLSIQSFSPPSNINSFVDSWVSNNALGTENTISVYAPDFFKGIVSYGYSFSKTSGNWWGWTFNDLKQFIDRFHYHGWKVIMETTGIAFWDHISYSYIKNQHKELSFTDANGVSAADKNIDIVIDMFANFSSDDTTRNISAGARLLDIYATRLKQQILDGIRWDGWFGSDGWNGPMIQGYWWGNNWGDPLPSNDEYYSFSAQEITEWAVSTKISLPPTWSTMTLSSQRTWIRNNASADWFLYWNLRWAKMYAQIRSKAREANPNFVMVKQIDDSADWTGWGPQNPSGMMNITMWVQENSADYYTVLTEGTNLGYDGSDLRTHAELPKIEAYTAGLLKSKAPEAHLIAGVQVQYWTGELIPNWVAKQEYLAEAQTYVWHNGTQYQAVDPGIVWVQYPDYDYPYYFSTETKALFNWIRGMAQLFQPSSLTPVYLGPAYVLPSTPTAVISLRGFNYSFAQYIDVWNIRNHPEYIKKEIGSILFDMIHLRDAPASTLLGLQDRVLQLYSSASLSVIFISSGWSPALSDDFGSSASESKLDSAFHLSSPSAGSSLTARILSGIPDPYGAWIASGYEGQTYSLTGSEWGNYLSSTGFIPVMRFDDQRLMLGIFYNATSGRFVYGRNLAGNIDDFNIPRGIMNRAIYWGSGSPITSSEPLLDYKVFKSADKIFIPMINHRDMGASNLAYQGKNLTSSLSLDTSVLGLGSPSNYQIYWQSSGNDRLLKLERRTGYIGRNG